MMATAKKTSTKTSESSKPNPFEKLKQAKAEAVSEEAVVAEAKERVAAKRAVRAAKDEPETEEVEETEEVDDADAEVLDGAEEVAADEGPAAVLDDSDEESDTDEDGDEESAEPVAEKPKAAPKKRRTAAQVEAEAAEREEALQRQIDELKQRIEGKADAADIAVVRDRVVLEDGVGGDVRVLGNGKTLANDDWRATVDGLRLILGRASSQSTSSIQLPVSLIPSLAELLGCLDEIEH